jgi:acyl transferase domain-containing protein
LVLGSVKTNLGHLETAAGVAGFIKTVLSVQRGIIPAPALQGLTPHAGPGAAKFTIARRSWRGRRWIGCAGPGCRRSVSGTNAHVVVEQAPELEAAAAAAAPVVTSLVLSGKSAARVAASAGVLAEWLEGRPGRWRWRMWRTPWRIIGAGSRRWRGCVRGIGPARSPA